MIDAAIATSGTRGAAIRDIRTRRPRAVGVACNARWVPRPSDHHVCSHAATRPARWHGRCPGCEAWNTLEPAARAARRRRPAGAARASPRSTPRRLREVQADAVQRLATGIGELDRVLGGGLVPGSLVLIGGSPGIGKSTLTAMALGPPGGRRAPHALRVRRGVRGAGRAARAAAGRRRARRARRGRDRPRRGRGHAARRERPEVCVVDSVQTLHAAGLDAGRGLRGAGARGGRPRGAAWPRVRGSRSCSSATSTRRARWPARGCSSTSSTACCSSRASASAPTACCARTRTASARPTSWACSRCAARGWSRSPDASARFVEAATRAPRQRRAGGDGGLAAAAGGGSGARVALGDASRRGGCARASTATAWRSCWRCSPATAGWRSAARRRVRQRGGRPARGRARRRPRGRPGGGRRGLAAGPGDGEGRPGPLACFGELGLTGELRAVAHAERRLAEAVRFGLAPVIAPPGAAPALRGPPARRPALRSRRPSRPRA